MTFKSIFTHPNDLNNSTYLPAEESLCAVVRNIVAAQLSL
jgi:hypothetical protein